MIRITWFLLAALAVLTLPGVAHADGLADLNAGMAAQTRGDLDGAIQLYTRAIDSGDLTPENQVVAYNNRGGAYLDKGDQDAALRDFDAMIRIDPNLAKGYYNRALVHEQKKNDDAALGDLDTALRLNPGLAEAYFGRGRIYDHKGDYDAALRDYSAALRLDRNFADVYLRRAILYESHADYDAAIRDVDAVLRLRPSDFGAYFYRGRVYLHKGDYSAALDNYDAALRINSELPIVIFARGIVRFVIDRFAEAARDFAHARQLPVQDPYTTVWLYLSRARAGQPGATELAEGAKILDEQSWAGQITALFLRKVSADQLLEAAERPDAGTQQSQRCIAVFFIGEQDILDQNLELARQHLAEALDLCPGTRIESIVARAELSRLGR